MLHEKPVQYNRPDGSGIGADAASGEWTGEKRRKQLGPLHSEVRTCSSDSPSAQRDQEDPFFTTADPKDFTIDPDEVLEITTLMKEKASIFVDRRCILDDESQRHVYKRLVLYRLKAHKLSKGDPIDNDKTLELPGFLEKETEHIFQLHFDVDDYFKRLEIDEGGSVGWYFDSEFSKLKDLADYQRLVLKNHDDVEYLDWEGYRSNFSTYKMDKDYVMFFTEMSEKLQWLKEYIETKESYEWIEKETIGAQQVLKIAKKFSGVTVDLAYTAYREHIWRLHNDYWFFEDWDTVFFEIWKLVTHTSLKFTPALKKVMAKHVVRRHEMSMLRFLNNRRLFDLKSKFDSCVKDIPDAVEDPVAEKMIRDAVWKLPRPKILYEYKMKKMEIAENLGLDKDCGEPRMLAWEGNCRSNGSKRSTCGRSRHYPKFA